MMGLIPEIPPVLLYDWRIAQRGPPRDHPSLTDQRPFWLGMVSWHGVSL